MLSGSLTSETLNFVSSGWVDLASVSPHLAIIGQQVDTSQTFPNDLDNCQHRACKHARLPRLVLRLGVSISPN